MEVGVGAESISYGHDVDGQVRRLLPLVVEEAREAAEEAVVPDQSLEIGGLSRQGEQLPRGHERSLYAIVALVNVITKCIHCR